MAKTIKSRADAETAGHTIHTAATTKKKLKDFGVKATPSRGGCAGKKPGDICYESACKNGQKVILFCDGSNGCTRSAVVPC